MALESGDINLALVLELQQSIAACNSLVQQVRGIDADVKKVAASGSSMDQQLTKAGRSLLHIGRGGVFLAVIAELKMAIALANEYEEALAKAGKKQGERAFAGLSLAQAMPKGVSGAAGAALVQEFERYGATRGLKGDQTTALLAPMLAKMKGKGADEIQMAGYAAIDLSAAGVSTEEAQKRARGAGALGAVQQAEFRKRQMFAQAPELELAERNRTAAAMADYERAHPTTGWGRKTQTEAMNEPYAASISEIAGLRAGYMPEEGKRFGLWQEGKQALGGGIVQRNLANLRGEVGGASAETAGAVATVAAARELGAGIGREVRQSLEGGSR